METNGEPTAGRPRKRCLDDVCNDLQVMNGRKWKEVALNRKAWNDPQRVVKLMEEEDMQKK
jgi:hypothetical protein